MSPLALGEPQDFRTWLIAGEPIEDRGSPEDQPQGAALPFGHLPIVQDMNRNPKYDLSRSRPALAITRPDVLPPI